MVNDYLERITIDIAGRLPTLALLTELQAAHLLTVPFENLDVFHRRVVTTSDSDRSHRATAIAPQPVAWGFLLLPAIAQLVLHLSTSGRFGIFRDEYYYLACAERLAWATSINRPSPFGYWPGGPRSSGTPSIRFECYRRCSARPWWCSQERRRPSSAAESGPSSWRAHVFRSAGPCS